MTEAPTRGRRKRRSGASPDAGRRVDYRNLTNPFPVMNAVSDDEAENIHQTALRVLQELGVRVLLPEARDILRAGGASVNDDDFMVRIGAETGPKVGLRGFRRA